MNLSELSFLFQDMDSEMDAIFEADSLIVVHRAKIAEHTQKAEEADAREAAARAKSNALEVEIAALTGRIKDLTRQRNVAIGEVSSAVHNAAYLRRLAADRERAIEKRKKDLVFNEGKRRLRKIGSDIKRNVGRRGGGGVDVVT